MSLKLSWMLPVAALIGQTCPVFADAITNWNERAIALVTPRMVPPAAQRAVAIVQVAMFDAVNSIERRYRPYLVDLSVAATTSKEAAAAAAAGAVLVGLVPEAQVEIRSATKAYLAALPDGGKVEGIELGEMVASKIMAVRANDGSNAADAYRPKTKPGGYVPTPAVVGSVWPNVKPFAMAAPAQFRPQPPVFLHSEQWAADYNEMIDSARFMALTAVALADAYI